MIVLNKIQSAEDLYKVFSNSKNVLITTKNLDTKEVKRIYTTHIPPLEIKKAKGNYSLKVVVSSTEAEDTQLLHELYKLTT
jgi:hypothetical protein